MSLSKIVSCLDTHIRPRVAGKAVASLTRADMLGIRDALVAQCKRGMANQTVAYFRAALRWAEDTGLIAEAPRWRVARLRLPSRAHALNENQWRQMLVALNDVHSGLHPIGRLALLALALTGCRKGEIAGLRWADVTDDGVRLTRHKTSAQTGPKTIEVHDALRCLLLDAKRTVMDLADTQPTVRLRDALLTSPFVFPSISRNGIGGRVGRVIEDTWAEVRRRAGLPASMTIHGLRGAFITQAQRLGVPLATVAAMVGHESPLTTLRHYSAPTRGEVAESVQRVATWITDRVGTSSQATKPHPISDSLKPPTGRSGGFLVGRK